MHLQLNQIRRRMVLDATGSVLGRVKTPLVDLETWSVDKLRVRLSRKAAGELSLAWTWWRPATMDIPTGLINAAGDAILLRVSLGELRDAIPSTVEDMREAIH
jgi:sporulation protein YlmC with PRC-barrel domain